VRVGSTPSPKRLIVNADDYGLSRSVNIGIIEAAESGVVTAASMMVNLPAFDDAVRRATSCSRLSLGLHLNLTTGRPLTAAPSLTRRETGDFYPLPALIARASLGLVQANEVQEECTAQLDRMIDSGFPPTHLDSHRHVHIHPALNPPVLRAARASGITQVRIPLEPLWANVGDWRATVKKIGLRLSTAIARRNSSGTVPRHFFGISLQGGSSFAQRLFGLIPRLPAGTSELMTHPGYADTALAEHDDYTWQRAEELRVLCSVELRDLIRQCGIELAGFDDWSSRRTPHGQLAQHR